MVQTQKRLRKSGPTRSIIASMVVGMLAITLWLKRGQKKKVADEHAIHLGVGGAVHH